MNRVHYATDKILHLFHDQRVATMPQLKAALGTTVAVTVFRKLSSLPYRSSYSHCGAYYTLDSIARFDELGLWSYQGIHFSRSGTLLDTAAALVSQAPAGHFSDELEAMVQVAVKDPLRHLVRSGRLSRRQWAGRYWYGAPDRARRQEQWAARQALHDQGDDLQKAMVLFYSLLDEQQRRLYAGLESLQCGHGGEQLMAKVFGLNVDTVARGRNELLSGQVLRQRVRRSGGGRRAVEKKRPKS
jgi:hypothetical protein